MLLLGAAFALSSLTGCRAQQPWPLWEAYSKGFIDDQGRVIDHTAGDRTTSEGQAYAMFFALVDNDRPRFDKILHWTEQNLAGGDLTLHLPELELGQDGDRRVEDDRRQLGFGRRPMDGIHARRGGASVAGAALRDLGPDDGRAHRPRRGDPGAGRRDDDRLRAAGAFIPMRRTGS